MGCEEETTNVITDSTSTSYKHIIVSDTNVTATIQFEADSITARVHLDAVLRLKTEVDSVRIIQYTISGYNTTISSDTSNKIIRRNFRDTLHIRHTFKNPIPFTEYFTGTIQLRYISYLSGSASTFYLQIQQNKKVDWQGKSEPGIFQIPMANPNQFTSGHLWARAGNGFYFNLYAAGNEKLSYYSLTDSSITEIALPITRFNIFDISHEDRYLLLCDNNGKPSNMYVYDFQTSQLRVIIDSLPSTYINSGKFSADDSKIVFGTRKHLSNSYEYKVWLLNRKDSTLRSIEEFMGSATSVISWFPKSNDKFVLSGNSTSLLFYSLLSQTKDTRYFSYPFYPKILLEDGYSILGLRYNYSGSSSESQIMLYSIFGQMLTQLTFYQNDIFGSALSPDGTKLLFTGYRNNKWGMWIKNVNVYSTH